jgi:tetratricopeptide (TPR) repeat protein
VIPSRWPFAVLLVTALLVPCPTQAGDGLPFKVTRLDDRVVTVSAMTGNSTAVGIASEKGLVLIDAMWSPSIATQLRETVAKEFGRDDFAYLMLSCDDILLTGGTEAFRDIDIIAHDRCRESLERRQDSLDPLLARREREFRGRVERTEAALAENDPDLEAAGFDRNWLELCQRIADDLATGYEIVLPNVTFKDRLTIDLGDLTLHLIYFGRASNQGDLIVHVPEVGLVMLGDVFHFGHMLARGRDPQVNRWLEVMDGVLEEESQVIHVIRSNSPGPWTRERLISHRDFIRDITEKVDEADVAGWSLQETTDRLGAFEEEFPYVARWEDFSEDWGRILRDDIRYLVGGIWKQSHESAADAISNTLDAVGIEEAKATLLRLRSESGNDLYFLESEFNSLGYRLLGEEKIDEAIAVFQMAVELYPESSNVYDSLGEGYMVAGKKDLAIRNYRKSLELNPENSNAVEMLRQLEE